MGLLHSDIDRLYPDIVAFADLGDVMEQPTKTYSSGMMIRLAFAVATSVEPAILIIDEALSVGDALFARKSFDRIMNFKKAGKTILFCSHSLYQVEAICSRVIWLHQGAIRMDGLPAEVIAAYNEFLGTPGGAPDEGALHLTDPTPDSVASEPAPSPGAGSIVHGARILAVTVGADGDISRKIVAHSGMTDITVQVRFASDPALPAPGIGVLVNGADGRTVSSAGTGHDGFELERSSDGMGEACVTFPRFALLKGTYWISVYLLSEDGIHVYDQAEMAAEITVRQEGLEQGIVSLRRVWSQNPAPAESESARK
jgi:lipopolysaccharide transport system ATP-binding protein